MQRSDSLDWHRINDQLTIFNTRKCSGLNVQVSQSLSNLIIQVPLRSIPVLSVLAGSGVSGSADHVPTIGGIDIWHAEVQVNIQTLVI